MAKFQRLWVRHDSLVIFRINVCLSRAIISVVVTLQVKQVSLFGLLFPDVVGGVNRCTSGTVGTNRTTTVLFR